MQNAILFKMQNAFITVQIHSYKCKLHKYYANAWIKPRLHKRVVTDVYVAMLCAP